MASLPTQTFGQIVTNMVTAIQGATAALVDFTVGSVLLAVAQAVAGLSLWLQAIALQIAALTRFATSSGPDADSWGADFDFERLPAKSSTGPVTLSRNTPTAQASVPAGSIVQTQDGTEQFTVVADTSQAAWNAGDDAYVIPAGTASITATVVAVDAGSGGNVAIGAINTLGTAIAGVDSVSNAAAFTNGADAESDAAYRGRFPSYIASLEKATKSAIINAAISVQQGLTASLTENLAYNGAPQQGYFYLVVNDGSGSPPGALLTAIANVVDAVRPVGTSFGVFGPTVVNVTIIMTVTVASGYSHATVAAAIQAALEDYINALPIGGTLPYTMIASIAYQTSPGVTNVSAVTVNSGTADIVATAQQVMLYSSATVN